MRIKRLVTVLTMLTLVLSLAVGTPVAAQEGGVNISIQPFQVAAQVGDTFSVDIQIDAGDQQVAGVDAFINFDPTYLEVVAIIANLTKLDTEMYKNWDNTNGYADYCSAVEIWEGMTYPTGTFTLVVMDYNSGGGTGPYDLFFSRP